MELLNTQSFKLEIDGNVLYEEGKKLACSARILSDMKNVLMDPEVINEDNGSQQIYFMFRGAGGDRNKTMFERHAIRYDVTIIPKLDLGREFNKTLGV